MSSDSRKPVVIVLNDDGTYTRDIQLPTIPATLDTSSHVVSKDLPINPANQTWLRIHIPKPTLTTRPKSKLPLIVYYHGGGFVFLSAATNMIHNFCNELAVEVGAVVANVEYRLAPEHRLPAAYEDAVEALQWIKGSREQWLSEFADLSNCYIMGTSAGANIAYHAGLRAAAEAANLEPLKIRGCILHHPFFGGSERTDSEIRLANSGELTLSLNDQLWEFSLPIDSNNHDHEYSNPLTGDGPSKLDRFRTMGWRVLLTGRFGDLLIDRQMEFAKVMEEKGVKNVTHYGEGYHGIELYDESKAKELFGVVSSFLST